MSSYNAGVRSHVRTAEKAQAQHERAKAEIITNLMDTTPGRSWVLSLLETAHVFASSFDRDPVAMAFNEGERNHGLILFNDILRYCPDQYILMMRENNERHTASERTRGTVANGGDSESSSDPGSDTDYPSDPDATTH